MKRSALARKTPMSRGTAQLARSTMRRKAPKKRAGHDKTVRDLCRDQPCYLLIPGVPRHDRATVVPCHANEIALGKGFGLKVPDMLTVPGCHLCHYELDQGGRLARDEKQSAWRNAYSRWGPYREAQFNVPYVPLE